MGQSTVYILIRWVNFVILCCISISYFIYVHIHLSIILCVIPHGLITGWTHDDKLTWMTDIWLCLTPFNNLPLNHSSPLSFPSVTSPTHTHLATLQCLYTLAKIVRFEWDKNAHSNHHFPLPSFLPPVTFRSSGSFIYTHAYLLTSVFTLSQRS